MAHNCHTSLLIDLHGRNKSDGLTQIGYNITKADLITETYQVNESSIGTLAMENSAIDYIGGKYSFGDLMESEGYAAVPSPAQRRPPGKSLFYFSFENSQLNKEVCN